MLSEKPDIVAITETWLNENISDSEISFEGYTLIRRDRKDVVKQRGGGVLLYIRSSLNPVEMSNFSRALFPEIVFCNITCKGEKTLIGVCYRPPDSKQENDEALYSILGEFKNKTFILLGDFNYSELNWGDKNNLDNSHSFVDCLDNNFICQLVNKPTRGKNFLDLILSSDENLVKNLIVGEPFETSDHQVIRFSIMGSKCNKTKKFPVYEYFKANYDQIRHHAKTLGWEALKDSNSVHDIWHKLKTDILSIREKFITVRRRPKSKAQWATNRTKRFRRSKKRAWLKFRESGQKPSFYDRYRQKLKLSMRENKRAKLAFERRLADNIKHNSKAFYSYVNSKSRSNKKIGPLRGGDGQIITSNKHTADYLNSYFCTVFTKENLDNIPNPVMLFNGNAADALSGVTIDENQLLSKLNKIDVGKSLGPDNIHPKLLYELRFELLKPLTRLFNLSIEQGEIPQDWRDANVSPIFKKGNRDQAQNYRPVSLTSVVGKILESFIKNSIVEHLEQFKLLRLSQHGFLKGRSCLTNLMEFFDLVTEKLDNGEELDLIYLDFAKAFDKVPFLRLLKKLEVHGIRGDLLNWVKTWLSNRRQRVGVDGEYSGWAEVCSGVPQGSVLGPILFLIYINDIDLGLISKISKFADDSKLLNSVKNSEGVDEIRRDLKNLEVWAEKWQMEFNTDKCSVIHLGKNNPNSTYHLFNKEIKSSTKERDLGVIVDGTMKFSEQCNTVVNSANATLGMIKRTLISRNKDVVTKVYKALVRPKLEYCVQVWRPYLLKDIYKLERVQHRATKFISECRGLNYEDRLRVTGLTTLQDRRDRGDMLEVFKTLKGFNKVDHNQFFKLAESSNTRGHSLKLLKERARLDCRQNFFSNRVVNKWNSLPRMIVDSPNVNSFKNRYDKFYFTK